MGIWAKNRDSCTLSPLSNAKDRISITLSVKEIFLFKDEVVYDKTPKITHLSHILWPGLSEKIQNRNRKCPRAP